MSPYSVSPREEVLVKQSSELVSSKEKGQVWSTLVREAGDGQRGQRNAPAQGRLPYTAGRQLRAVLGTRAGEHRPLVLLQRSLKRSYPLPLSAPAHSNPGLRVSNYLPPPPPPGEKKRKKRKRKIGGAWSTGQGSRPELRSRRRTGVVASDPQRQDPAP